MPCMSTSAQRTRNEVLKRNSSCCIGSVLLIGDQGAHTGIGEDFQQYRVGYPSIDDDRAAHATLHRVQRAADLGQHAAIDGAIGNQLIDLGGTQSGQHLAFLVHQPRDVGQQHELLRAQGLGHLAGHQIGIDVIGLAVLAHADRSDHRNEIVGNQPVDQVDVDPGHFTDTADVEDLRLVHARRLAGDLELACADQVGVLAGQAQGLAAMLVDQVDDVLVHLTAEHHFNDVHGGIVGHPHALDEFAVDVQALEQVADLRATAVHHHRVDADGLHQNDVLADAGLQLLAFHGIAAVLDVDGFAGKALDIGQRFGEDARYLGGGVTVEHDDGVLRVYRFSSRSGATAPSCWRNVWRMRSSPAASSASKRSTSTGVVFEARTSPQPSG